MHPEVLTIICCPACRGDLEYDNEEINELPITTGTIRCRDCRSTYPVEYGILNLLTRQHKYQEREIRLRNRVAKQDIRLSKLQIMKRLRSHHCLPIMGKAAKNFSLNFSKTQWMLDIGAGWAWAWKDVTSPHIIALDFSFESLLIAKKLLGSQVDQNIHLICADASRLPIKPISVRGVWSTQALQHMQPSDLQRCLELSHAALVKPALIEFYWINRSTITNKIVSLLRKILRNETSTQYYLNKITAPELSNTLSSIFRGQIEMSYNETIFHPEIRLPSFLHIPLVDQCIASIPWVNKKLGRQVIAKGKISPTT